MRIFLDTANINQIRQAARLGIISGVTTNSTLVSKEKMADNKATIKEIYSIIDGAVSDEVMVEVNVFKHYQLSTEVIAASIRYPQHCVAAAKAGAHIATVPYNVLMQMIRHPLTEIGVTRFLTDWQHVSQG